MADYAFRLRRRSYGGRVGSNPPFGLARRGIAVEEGRAFLKTHPEFSDLQRELATDSMKLGDLEPGRWRRVPQEELRMSFPDAPMREK